MDQRQEHLGKLVRKIYRKDILLPDFQRGFVWTDEERQKKLVASVLAKMPLGSILLLKSNGLEYAYKEIGSKNFVKNDEITGEVEFMIDGQQRVTVLTAVFSNIVFKTHQKVKDIVDQVLRRFFIVIPKYSNLVEGENDLFGAKKLQFPLTEPDTMYPKFLSADVLEMIHVKGFKKTEDSPFNYYKKDDFDRSAFTEKCVEDNHYLVPLFLLIEDDENRTTNSNLLLDVLIKITTSIIEDIMGEYQKTYEKTSEEDQYIESILPKDLYLELKNELNKSVNMKENFDNERNESKIKYDTFKEKLNVLAEYWRANFKAYLDSCLKDIGLNQIVLSESERDRAIDIYENLNLGGKSLDIFDLILARVAKVSTENFHDRLVAQIKEKGKYNFDVLPESTMVHTKNYINNHKNYSASLDMDALNSDTLSKKYIEIFLNVLSTHIYSKNMKEDDHYNVSMFSRPYKLSLKPEHIDSEWKKACIAIDRACFFLKSRCGVRSLMDDSNYKLVVVVIAMMLLDDDNFAQKKIHALLEAWYWSTMFSGEFDSDPNKTCVRHLGQLADIIKSMRNNEAPDLSWLINLSQNIMDKQNFSDKNFWLHENVEITNRVPKNFLTDLVCQYYLSSGYDDLFKTSENYKYVFTYSSDDLQLEKHHVIPLGSSTTTINESTDKLRRDKENVLNSPINYIYIPRESNNFISDKELHVYRDIIHRASSNHLLISYTFFEANIEWTSDNIKRYLGERFDSLKAKVTEEVKNLINQCEIK